MLNTTDVLSLLDHKSYCSGQELANQLNVTRATIHNCISRIEALGIKIERIHGLGYRLEQPLDLLSKDQIVDKLSEDIQSKAETIECLQEVNSTNHYAGELDLPKAGNFSVVLAEMQTAGKGRRGREWVSPYAANIYLSLVWSLQKPLHIAGMLSPYLAMRLAQMLKQAGVSTVGVKWPNDIYCDDKKLAGILIECKGEINGLCKIIVGVGVNVSMTRYENISIEQSWTDIDTQAPNLNQTRNALASMLITTIVQGIETFEQNKINNFAQEWSQWDVMKDKNIIVQSESSVQSGIARGISEDGNLLLETPAGEIEKIIMGEVSLREQQ